MTVPVWRLLAGLLIAGSAVGPAHAGQVSVAVAANFSAVLDELAVAFEAKTGDELIVSSGPTGGLYTQITQGAPFEIFFAADNKRPQQAVDEGFGVVGSVFTYAVGKLVLYSTTLDLSDGKTVLESGAFQHIAVADPTTAPYGAAALEVMEELGVRTKLAGQMVTGESVTQALQFVESGNAELGFVALSQVIGKPGSRWLPSSDLHAPIIQDAVLLKAGEANPAATAFLTFLASDEAAGIITAAGYMVAD